MDALHKTSSNVYKSILSCDIINFRCQSFLVTFQTSSADTTIRHFVYVLYKGSPTVASKMAIICTNQVQKMAVVYHTVKLSTDITIMKTQFCTKVTNTSEGFIKNCHNQMGVNASLSLCLCFSVDKLLMFVHCCDSSSCLYLLPVSFLSSEFL